MADQILIRKLPPGAKQRLRERAAAHGRSLEAEARAILIDTAFTEDLVLNWLDAAGAAPEGPAFEAPDREGDWAPTDFS